MAPIFYFARRDSPKRESIYGDLLAMCIVRCLELILAEPEAQV